jgi:hypothetical protein
MRVDIDEPQVLGAPLDRSLSAPGERAEKEIDAFIARRHAQKRGSEDLEEKKWEESEARQEAARAAHLRKEWSEYHNHQAERHRATLKALIAHHEGQAERLGT